MSITIKKVNWEIITYSGKHHAILFIDTVFQGYRKGYIGDFFEINFNPKYYRQFDGARWWKKEEVDTYLKLLNKKEERNPGFLLRKSNGYKKFNEEFLKWASSIKPVYSKLSNEDLGSIFNEFIYRLCKINALVYTPIFLDRFLTDQITEIIIKKEKSFDKQQQYLEAIFSLDYGLEVHFERESLIKLAEEYEKNKHDISAIRRAIKTHINKFKHLSLVAFYQKPMNEGSIVNELESILSKGIRQEKKYLTNLKNRSAEINEIFKKLDCDKFEILKIKTLRAWAFIANNDDHYVMGAIRKLWPLWGEIAKRLKISFNQLIEATSSEIEHWIEEGFISRKMKDELSDRVIKSAIIMDPEIRILAGRALNSYYRKEVSVTNLDRKSIIKGISATKGKSRGRVKILRDIRDISKIKKGDILVAVYTYPAIVSAIRAANAVVTDQGGLLSHAAIVSREFNKPCIVGTKIATQVLHDGDLVEVDADRGMVRILEKS